ncbi:MAG TPA: STAS domain-containing protein [Solirubrobacterales bacterium]|jgi:anti-anti-sigma factor
MAAKADRTPAIVDCGGLTVAISRQSRNRLLVELRGELDMAAASELERKLYLPRRAKVDLDLSGVTFVDAAGMRVLLGVWDKRGGRAKVIASSPAVTQRLS